MSAADAGVSTPIAPVTVGEPEAAIYFGGVSPSFLRKARMTGRGPAYVRIGRSIRYRIADLDAYLLANRVEPRAVRR